MPPRQDGAIAQFGSSGGSVVAAPPDPLYASGRLESKPPVEFFAFDRDYVQRLAEGDAETERHFVSYFSGLLLVKLRSRLRSEQDTEDLRQEVFLRVLRSLRVGPGLREPERLGAYVNTVCNNIVFEHFRAKGRFTQLDPDSPNVGRSSTNLEKELVTEESQRHVRALIDELPVRDREILRAIFLEERDKDEVCTQFGVRREYLRVLLHRAKSRFRHLLTGEKPMAAPSPGRSH
jgi:RNA polymerase sigma-70 factor (ECF subfamily)